MCIYTPFIGKREIGGKTGNGWENGKPVEGVFVCWLSVLLQGACPPSQGACGVHPYGSPHGRRMVAAWSPHVNNKDIPEFDI